MRSASLFLPAVCSVLAVCACASTGEGEDYQDEYNRLNASCEERGGMLVASGGASSGRPALDYVCDIRGGGLLTSERTGQD